MIKLGTVSTILGVSALAFTLWMSESVVQRQDRKDRTVVVYWEKWTGFEDDAMRAIVADFNQSQDKIFVKYLSISGIMTKTLLATSGGNPPDIAGLANEPMTEYANANALTDLTDLAAESGIRESQYIPGYWDMITHRGRLIGMPSTPVDSAMHVNRALMPAEYKEPENFPKTIEELDKLADKVTIRKDGRIILSGFLQAEPGWWNWGWGNVFGGKLFDGEKLTVNSPENVRAFEWVASYSKKYGATAVHNFTSGLGTFASPQNAFLSGKVSCELQGVWMSNFIQKYSPSLDWYAVPFPIPQDRPDLKDSTFLGLDTLVIPKGSKHVKEAWEFIRYVQQQKVMEKLCSLHGKNSPLVAVSDEFFSKHRNKYIRLFDRLARSPNGTTAPKIGIWNQLQAEMNNAFEVINLGQKTPQEALNNVQTRMSAAYERYKQQEAIGE